MTDKNVLPVISLDIGILMQKDVKNVKESSITTLLIKNVKFAMMKIMNIAILHLNVKRKKNKLVPLQLHTMMDKNVLHVNYQASGTKKQLLAKNVQMEVIMMLKIIIAHIVKKDSNLT